MEFHPDKCQILRITNKRQPLKFTYNIHNIDLHVFKSAKYLGVTIDSNLNWTVQTENVYKMLQIFC